MNPAVPANAVLDGHELGDATSWQIMPKVAKVIRSTAMGDRREQRAHQTPGLPLIKVTREFTIDWAHVPDGVRDTLAWILATPGEHELTLWRPEHVVWMGDGVRAEFSLPSSWSLAVDGQAVPGGLSADRFAPTVKIGSPQGVSLAFALQDQASYDAGSPAPDAVWFREGGNTLKVPPVAVGQHLYGKIVPRFRVLVDPDLGQTSLVGPAREPKTVRLLEV